MLILICVLNPRPLLSYKLHCIVSFYSIKCCTLLRRLWTFVLQHDFPFYHQRETVSACLRVIFVSLHPEMNVNVVEFFASTCINTKIIHTPTLEDIRNIFFGIGYGN